MDSKINEMFPDWENINEGEWSKNGKSVTCWDYLNQADGFGIKDLDVSLSKVCFEQFKSSLFDEGYDTVSEFVGYDYSDEEDKDVTDNRIDEAYSQMPRDEFISFCKQYNLDKELSKAKLEVGLYREPKENKEYAGSLTLQAFVNDNVIFCEETIPVKELKIGKLADNEEQVLIVDKLYAQAVDRYRKELPDFKFTPEIVDHLWASILSKVKYEGEEAAKNYVEKGILLGSTIPVNSKKFDRIEVGNQWHKDHWPDPDTPAYSATFVHKDGYRDNEPFILKKEDSDTVYTSFIFPGEKGNTLTYIPLDKYIKFFDHELTMEEVAASLHNESLYAAQNNQSENAIEKAIAEVFTDYLERQGYSLKDCSINELVDIYLDTQDWDADDKDWIRHTPEVDRLETKEQHIDKLIHQDKLSADAIRELGKYYDDVAEAYREDGPKMVSTVKQMLKDGLNASQVCIISQNMVRGDSYNDNWAKDILQSPEIKKFQQELKSKAVSSAKVK